MPAKKITQGPATTAMDEVEHATEASLKDTTQSVADAIKEKEGENHEQGKNVLFVSAKPEVDLFDVAIGVEENEIIRGIWDSHGEHVVWRVPTDLAARFERHMFVVQGRILRTE